MLARKLKMQKILQDKKWKTQMNGLDKKLRMQKSMQAKKLMIWNKQEKKRLEKSSKGLKQLVRL